MIIEIVQPDIRWGDVHHNIRRVKDLINSQTKTADIIVLPEMWSTGFATQPAGFAEKEMSSVALAWMKETAQFFNCAVCGSLAIHAEDDTYRNRHYFIDGRNHKSYYYDKHHLFTYGGEDRYYKAGGQRVIVEYEGFRILLVTCYDLRFPGWLRYSNVYQYDMIICVANWPESRQNAFQILTRARAIENMAYLIACNRVGNDEYSHYRGCSCAISPIGKTLVQCQPNLEDVVFINLDIDSLNIKRHKFKVLNDRDIY